jgi:hypothetical protein
MIRLIYLFLGVFLGLGGLLFYNRYNAVDEVSRYQIFVHIYDQDWKEQKKFNEFGMKVKQLSSETKKLKFDECWVVASFDLLEQSQRCIGKDFLEQKIICALKPNNELKIL